MLPVDAVRAAIAERNREIAVEGWVELGMGVGFALLTYAAIFWLIVIFSFFSGGLCCMPTWLLAPLVTLIFAVVSVISAWRRVDPLAALEPMSDAEELVVVLSLATPNVMVVNPRRVVAGFAWLILGGPVSVFSAIESIQHRMPDDEALVRSAAEMLSGAERGMTVESVSDARAAVVLRRLALIKHESGPGKGRIVITEKGRSLAGGAPTRRSAAN